MPAYPFPRTLFFGYLAMASVYLLLLPLLPFTFDWVVKAAPVLLLAGIVFKETDMRLLGFALFASAVGDVMLAQQFPFAFEAGMLAFGIAHLSYALTFWPWRSPDKLKWISSAVLLALTVAVLTVLVPQSGSLAVPISVYALVIVLMTTTAIMAASRAMWMLPAGAAIFVLSDTLIGVNLFLLDSGDSKISVMVTYYAAQWLLFWGARRRALAA